MDILNIYNKKNKCPMEQISKLFFHPEFERADQLPNQAFLSINQIFEENDIHTI